MRKELTEELYSFLLKDSKVPDMVIEGVGKFIDFKKYLGIAVERGSKKGYEDAEAKYEPQIKTLGEQVERLEAEKTRLIGELDQLRTTYDTAMETTVKVIPKETLRKRLGKT